MIFIYRCHDCFLDKKTRSKARMMLEHGLFPSFQFFEIGLGEYQDRPLRPHETIEVAAFSSLRGHSTLLSPEQLRVKLHPMLGWCCTYGRLAEDDR